MKKLSFLLAVLLVFFFFVGSAGADYITTYTTTLNLSGHAEYTQSRSLVFQNPEIKRATKKERKALRKELNRHKGYTGKAVIEYDYAYNIPDWNQPAEWSLLIHFEVDGKYKLKGKKRWLNLDQGLFETEIPLGKFSGAEAYARYEDYITALDQMPYEDWEDGTGGYYNDFNWKPDGIAGTLYLASVTDYNTLRGNLMESVPSEFAGIAGKFLAKDFLFGMNENDILKKADLTFGGSLQLRAVPYQEPETPPEPSHNIPEPSTLLLLGAGVLALAGAKGRMGF